MKAFDLITQAMFIGFGLILGMSSYVAFLIGLIKFIDWILGLDK